MKAPLLEYIYLDGPGIDSLYAQTVKAVETSRTLTTQKARDTKISAGVKLKNLLVRLIAGVEAEAAGEYGRSKTHARASTRVRTIEHRLQAVISFLKQSTEFRVYEDLHDACRYAKAADLPVFVNVRETFNAPQFRAGAAGAIAVNATGYLLLEKYAATDYRYNDDYFKAPSAPVKMSANVAKMRGGGPIGASSHEARYFAGYAGRDVPLSVFGTLAATPQYFQIKPFAIWR